jgi:hypothetical protein
MATKRKFRKGEQIRNLEHLCRCLGSGRWIYWNHKPLHPGWILSMTLQTLRGGIMRGILWIAEPNEDGGTEVAS